jgi:hypothetical protein
MLPFPSISSNTTKTTIWNMFFSREIQMLLLAFEFSSVFIF